MVQCRSVFYLITHLSRCTAKLFSNHSSVVFNITGTSRVYDLPRYNTLARGKTYNTISQNLFATALLPEPSLYQAAIYFNRKHVFYAMCIMWIEIVVLSIGVSVGVFPNAPLYIDAVKAEQVPLVYSFAQLLMSLPVALVIYALGYSLMRGLVLKEKKILELSRTDALTGLWNRRYLNELLAHEIALTYRDLYPLSVIIVDLDCFKIINDTYGHAAGDQVLMRAAEVLKQNVRAIDCVGRFGGEEFLIILSNCDEQEAKEVANRYRSMLEKHPVQIGDDVIYVTGSFGVTTISPSNTSQFDLQRNLDQIINMADKALYDAKNQGRNCVKFLAMSDGA